MGFAQKLDLGWQSERGFNVAFGALKNSGFPGNAVHKAALCSQTLL